MSRLLFSHAYIHSFGQLAIFKYNIRHKTWTSLHFSLFSVHNNISRIMHDILRDLMIISKEDISEGSSLDQYTSNASDAGEDKNF